MRATRLAALTTALAVAAVGLGAGHLMMPYAPGAPATRRVAFWGAMLAVGAWRGWREALVREDSARRTRWWIALGALVAAALALAAYWLFHGPIP